jgi:hypothetical protein
LGGAHPIWVSTIIVGMIVLVTVVQHRPYGPVTASLGLLALCPFLYLLAHTSARDNQRHAPRQLPPAREFCVQGTTRCPLSPVACASQ